MLRCLMLIPVFSHKVALFTTASASSLAIAAISPFDVAPYACPACVNIPC